MKKLSLLLLATTLTGVSYSQTLLNTTFESPAYALGDLLNQDGWVGTGNNSRAIISTQNPFSGTQNFQFNMGIGRDFGWLWKVSPIPSTSIEKLVSIKAKVRVNRLTGTPRTTSTIGIDCYSASVQRISSLRLFPSFDNGFDVPCALGFFSDPDGLGYTGYVWKRKVFDFGRWIDTELILDFNTSETRFKVNGISGSSLPINPAVLDFNDADLVTSTGGPSSPNPFVVCVDNYSISKFGGTNISGSVNLEGWPTGSSAPNMSDWPINLAIYDSPTHLVDSITTLPDFDGGFNVNSTVAPGTYDVVVSGGLCLNKRLINVSLPGPIIAALDTGDTDASNSINLIDYLNLAAAFDSVLDEEPGTEGNQPSNNWNSNCDFDGSGAVDTSDYLLQVANFDESGDS